MRPCVRGLAPPLLAEHGPAIAQKYVAQRAADSRYKFEWPRRDRQSLLDVVRDALRAMTDTRCSYCDGHPIDATGEEQIDHFQPKTDPRFHRLVCEWTNLFLCCSRCNRAKGAQWEPALLRPDDPDFTFERYFEYRFDTGELQPNGTGTIDDQARARRTIDILQLNRPGVCFLRKHTVKALVRHEMEEARAELPYRYLLAVCAP